MKKLVSISIILFLISISVSAQKKYSYTQAKDHIGEYAIVSGRVVNVFTTRTGTTFLDIGADYPDNPFTAVIFKSDAKNFKDVNIYENKTVEVKGKIKEYQGKPEIILKDSSEIKIVKKGK